MIAYYKQKQIKLIKLLRDAHLFSFRILIHSTIKKDIGGDIKDRMIQFV